MCMFAHKHVNVNSQYSKPNTKHCPLSWKSAILYSGAQSWTTLNLQNRTQMKAVFHRTEELRVPQVHRNSVIYVC